MLTNSPAHATLPTTDLARARAFYEGKLGFKPGLEMADGVMYDTGGTRFLVYPSGGKASGEHTQMGFVVDDIAAEVAELKQRGIEFLEYDLPGLKTDNSIAIVGDSKGAWFKDTEGNVLAVVQLST